MDKQQCKWDEYYGQKTSRTTDDWLDAYHEYFEGGGKVLDLGCGNGSSIPYLLQKSSEIAAIDYSEKAIKYVKEKWNVNAFAHDIRNQLPFGAESFDVILADLSLHYFSIKETQEIISDLYRIAKLKGILIARVNSINDTNHGFGIGKEIEPNYFDNDGERKRFFDKEMVFDFFDEDFVITSVCEKKTKKYEDEKILWEIVTIKIG